MKMMNIIQGLAKYLDAGEKHEQVVPITLFIAVLCLCLVIGHLLEENRWLNESITALVLGIIAGATILYFSKGQSSRLLTFDENLFFIYLLPPIIFNAGFQVKKKQFFHNFLTIMLFGVTGVFISSSIVAAGSWWMFPKCGFHGLTIRDYLSIGTIFSSTDTVCTLQVLHQDETPLLYSLVFGEGVVNDATSVVLFNSIQKINVDHFNAHAAFTLVGDFFYLFFTSTCLGVATGLLTALILKGLYFGKHSSVREVALMMLMAYLSYMLAELLDLSGILTVFFSGVIMSHYAWHNVTESSRITTSFWTSIGTYSILIFLILVGRAVFVFPLSMLSNFMNRRAQSTASITVRHQTVIWWAGLMRGAVSIALAFKQFTHAGVTLDPINATMVTTTIIVVLFSTIVFGLLTKPLITCLLPHSDSNSSEPRSPRENMRLPLLSFGESATTNIDRAKDNINMLIERPVYTVHTYWRRFDDAFMRPTFGGPRSTDPC